MDQMCSGRSFDCTNVLGMSPYVWVGTLLLCCLSSFSATAAESVAMVTDLKGQSTFVSPKGERPITILSELAAGSKIHLEAGGRIVVIYMKSGKEFQLDGPASISIGEAEPKLGSGGTLIRRTSLLTAETASLEMKGGKVIQGAIRMRDLDMNNVKLLMPLAKVIQQSPTFQWTTQADDQQFTLMLQEESSGKKLLETQVKGGSYSLPENIRLTPGEGYIWAVEFHQGHENVELLTASFTLASEKERNHFMQLKPKPDASFSDRIVYAALLEQADFREEAKAMWRELSAERPDLPELRSMATQ